MENHVFGGLTDVTALHSVRGQRAQSVGRYPAPLQLPEKQRGWAHSSLLVLPTLPFPGTSLPRGPPGPISLLVSDGFWGGLARVGEIPIVSPDLGMGWDVPSQPAIHFIPMFEWNGSE